MREWSRDERYKVLESADQIRDLHERISKSAYRQLYRNYLDASREKNLTISMIGMMLTAMSMARP